MKEYFSSGLSVFKAFCKFHFQLNDTSMVQACLADNIYLLNTHTHQQFVGKPQALEHLEESMEAFPKNCKIDFSKITQTPLGDSVSALSGTITLTHYTIAPTNHSISATCVNNGEGYLIYLLNIPLAKPLDNDLSSLKKELEEHQKKLTTRNMEISTLMDNISGGVHHYNLDDGISMSYASKGLYQMLGYSDEEFEKVLANDYSLALHPQDKDLFIGTLKKLAKSPGKFTIEYRILHKNGGSIWVEDTIKSFKDNNNQIRSFGIVININEAKKDHLTLQTLIDTLPGCVTHYEFSDELGLKVSYSNAAVSGMFGYSQEEFEKQSENDPLNNVLKEDEKKLSSALIGLITKDKPVDCRIRIKTKSDYTWVRLLAKSMSRYDNHIFITTIMFDITEEVSWERRSLWENERYRMLSECSDITTLDYDPISDFLIYYQSVPGIGPIEHELRNYSNCIGTSDLIHPDYINEYKNKLLYISSHPEKSHIDLYSQFGSKGYVWSRIYYTSLADENGEVYRVLGRIENIQSEKDAKTELFASIAREEAYRSALIADALFSITVDATTEMRIKSAGDIISPMYENIHDVKELLAKIISERIHKDDIDIAKTLWGSNENEICLTKKRFTRYVELRATSSQNAYVGYHWLSVHFYRYKDIKNGHCCYMIYAKDVNEKKLEELMLHEKAHKDKLTGLINRLSLEELADQSIELAQENNKLLAFILIDLDDFKKINDTYGHLAGDHVLQSTAKVLKSIFRQNDIVARLGGDELAVILTDVPSINLVHTKGKEICGQISQMCLEDFTSKISCSVGISIFPHHGDTFTELYSNADMALYLSKGAGKNKYHIYTDEMSKQ